jgi:ATP-binding cassette subfamily B protein
MRQAEADALSTALDDAVWPLARLGEAIDALARRAGLAPRAIEVAGAPAPDADAATLDVWIETTASTLGIEAEPVATTYVELESLLVGAAPALLRLPGGAARFVLLAGARGRSVTLLAPDLTEATFPVETLHDALALELDRRYGPAVDRSLASAEVGARARPAARRALLRERLATAPIEGAWLLRLPPGAPFLRQLAHAHLGRRLGALVGAHAAAYMLNLGAWWMIGQAALEGHIDRGWLYAWALLLLTQIPLRLISTWTAGQLAFAAGGLLKQRLLGGALQLAPEEIRHQGAGQLLGRVIESSAVEALALSAGANGLVALVELAFAIAVVAAGAGGWLHAVTLLLWIALTLRLGWSYYQVRRRWTGQRLDMTHELVERMIGHRTRLAQEPRARWHDSEDQTLERYLARSRELDAAAVRLSAIVSRGWTVVALLAIAAPFVRGASPPSLAVAVGGIVLAAGALKRLAHGLSGLAGASIAWEQVAPLFHAAARAERAESPAVAAAARTQGPVVLEAHDVVFRYRDRGEPVLREANLRVGRGDRLLLEGPSGGGKSTLGALLAGLRVPESGLLLLGGLDRRTLGPEAWRRCVVAAPQFHENHVLGNTFAFNLLMGRRWPPTPADLDEAIGVCRELELGPLLDKMPSGPMQQVGETGWQLSHGERSRLYIARALLQRAELVILDESFAALDPETLQRALACVLRRAPTVLVIAHP